MINQVLLSLEAHYIGPQSTFLPHPTTSHATDVKHLQLYIGDSAAASSKVKVNQKAKEYKKNIIRC